MSDVTVAPQAAPDVAPANEVPINPNPVSSPTPVGSQAPEKPQAEARRDAIKGAFDRANAGKSPPRTTRPEPKAAEAKKGHNQPPEDTPDEMLDLKRRPGDQPRGDRGQFAPRQAGEQARSGQERLPNDRDQAEGAPGQISPPTPGPGRTLPEHAPYRNPPQRMAEHAKAEWAAAPESIRGEVYRMHSDFNNAYQQYRGDHEVMNTLRPFHDLAQSQGTTLAAAVNNYVAIENKLREDPVGGLDVIVHNLGLIDPETGRKINLRDVAYHVLSQSPDQLKAIQTRNAQGAQSQQIQAQQQEISGLKNELHQLRSGLQFNYIRSGVDQYADDGRHPRFDELTDLIHHEIALGFDLDTAYRRAELLRPATHAAQTRNPSAQTRTPDRSISGSPGGTPTNGARRPAGPQPKSPRNAIQHAIQAVGRSH